MPTYEFKCSKCGKVQELILSIGEFQNERAYFDTCSNKKCGAPLYRKDQQINFAGGINMNNDFRAKSYRKYSNKQGGPQGIIGGTSTGKNTQKKGGVNVGRTGLL